MSVWDAIWDSDSYSTPKLREEKAKYKLDSIEEYISVNQQDICVDLGCGGGYISKELFLRNKCKVLSIDESKTAIEFAQKHNSFDSSQYLLSSATRIDLLDSSVDIVFCFGVLEHISEVDLALSEVERILKPKGKIVITSSNRFSIMFLDRIIKQLFRRWRYGYQKNWAPKGIQMKLRQHGFSIHNCSIKQGYGDFEIINKFDRAINHIIPCWGRYIQIIGEKQ